MRPRRYPTLEATFALLLFVFTSVAAEAQYFGQNKVQYRDFDFDVLKTEHLDIYYYPEARNAVEHAARLPERWYAPLSKLLSHKFEDRQAVIPYARHERVEQRNVIEGELD